MSNAPDTSPHLGPAIFAIPVSTNSDQQSRASDGLGENSLAIDRNIYEAATRDEQTGTTNRHFLQDTLNREIARSVRQQVPVTALIFLLENYQQVSNSCTQNDFGAVLREVARRISSECREDDLLSRMDEDRFCLVMAATNQQEATSAEDHFRKAMCGAFKIASGEINIHVKLGSATMNPASPVSPNSLLSQASANLS